EQTVKPLDIGVLHRFSWLDILYADIVLLTPFDKYPGAIFGSVIHSDNLRFSPPGNDLVHDGYNPFSGHGKVRFYGQYLPVVIVYDVKDPDLSSIYQGITHEIGAPAIV